MKASNNPFPSALFEEQADAPSTPAAGYSRVFAKADGLYIVDDEGNVTGPFVASAGGGGGGYTEGACVTHDAAQSIANASAETLAFNTELWDTDTCHDNTTNNSRLTCKTAGKYIVTFNGEWDSPSTTGTKLMTIKKNGTDTVAAYRDTGGYQRNSLSCIVDLDVNDYLEVIVYQGTGGAIDVPTVAYYSPVFAMQRIG